MKQTAAEVILLGAACLVAVSGIWGQAPGLGVDAAGTYWFYAWIKHSVLEGVSPFWTNRFFYPEGMDVVATTGFNFVDAYLSVPFQILFGFPHYLTPFLVVIFMGNALAIRALLRTVGCSRIAALAAGLVVALHPYIIFEVNNGRLTQALLWFWPLALRELHLMRQDRRWRRPVLAGLFIALQAWTYWFTAHFLILVGLAALLMVGWRMDRPWWARLTLAGLVSLAVTAPGILIMAYKAGQGIVPGMSGDSEDMGFSSRQIMTHAWWFLSPGSGIFKITLPTLITTFGVILLSRGRILLGLTATLALFFAAGPQQIVGGILIQNPLWQAAEALLPGFSRFLFPYRIWSVLAITSAAALALLLDRWFARPALRAAAALFLVLMIIWPFQPGRGIVHGNEVPLPAYIKAVRDAPGLVLDLPFPCVEEAIYLQPLHGQPLVTGMSQRLHEYRPAGLLGRLRDDPFIADIMLASRGIHHRIWSEDKKRKPGRPKIRWIVLHLGLYRRSQEAQICLYNGQGPPNPRAMLDARLVMEDRLGKPTVADQHVVAWDLWRIDPGWYGE